MSFEFANLAARYDRGLLVPFIGSGMSVPACATWKEMVVSLEQHAGLKAPDNDDLTWRSQRALESLRTSRANVRRLVYESIGNSDVAPPPQTSLLASLYWPLVCTTNYDDIYLRAVMAHPGRAMPLVFGRSEVDCRRVLQHLSMPVHEALWTLQGFLGGRNQAIRDAMPAGFDQDGAESEIVVGHAEYRRAANRAPHFRRCFAEVFRSKSLLFLGAGLTESYFLSLFDEIIELTGPPAQPHFALIPEGRVDVDFMLRHYNIICRTYPVDPGAAPDQRHAEMRRFLGAFCEFIQGERTRGCRWGYHLRAPGYLGSSTRAARFTVLRQTLPKRPGPNEAVAISCGRGHDRAAPDSVRGIALASGAGRDAVNLPEQCAPEWLGDSHWVVTFKDQERVYGIVARHLDEAKELRSRSRDRRSPDAIRQAFYGFLDEMKQLNIRTAYVQLLSAGAGRTFHPWVSLVQMARAYGEWHRAQCQLAPSGEGLVDVKICAVDPGVVAMLQGNYIDLGEQLQGAQLCLTIEVIHEDGEVIRHHRIVDGIDKLGSLIPHAGRIIAPYPDLFTLPAIHQKQTGADFVQSVEGTVRDFGLVSGSTLVVDFRRLSIMG